MNLKQKKIVLKLFLFFQRFLISSHTAEIAEKCFKKSYFLISLAQFFIPPARIYERQDTPYVNVMTFILAYLVRS
jgi:hypothetical protein